MLGGPSIEWHERERTSLLYPPPCDWYVQSLCFYASPQGKRSPLKREIFVPTSPKRVAIHESTPLAPRRLENGRTVSQVALLRSQLASLVRDKHATSNGLEQVRTHNRLPTF